MHRLTRRRVFEIDRWLQLMLEVTWDSSRSCVLQNVVYRERHIRSEDTLTQQAEAVIEPDGTMIGVPRSLRTILAVPAFAFSIWHDFTLLPSTPCSIYTVNYLVRCCNDYSITQLSCQFAILSLSVK